MLEALVDMYREREREKNRGSNFSGLVLAKLKH